MNISYVSITMDISSGFKELLFKLIVALSNILRGSPDFRILKFVSVSSGRCLDTKGEP